MSTVQRITVSALAKALLEQLLLVGDGPVEVYTSDVQDPELPVVVLASFGGPIEAACRQVVNHPAPATANN